MQKVTHCVWRAHLNRLRLARTFIAAIIYTSFFAFDAVLPDIVNVKRSATFPIVKYRAEYLHLIGIVPPACSGWVLRNFPIDPRYLVTVFIFFSGLLTRQLESIFSPFLHGCLFVRLTKATQQPENAHSFKKSFNDLRVKFYKLLLLLRCRCVRCLSRMAEETTERFIVDVTLHRGEDYRVLLEHLATIWSMFWSRRALFCCYEGWISGCLIE